MPYFFFLLFLTLTGRHTDLPLNLKILVTLICALFISQSAVFLKYHCTDNTHMHTQTSNTSLNTCEKTTRAVRLGNNCMLHLFGLVLNLRHFDLFPSEELPDSSSVVLIAQSVQEDVEGWRGLSQDGSHLQKGQRESEACWCGLRTNSARHNQQGIKALTCGI